MLGQAHPPAGLIGVPPQALIVGGPAACHGGPEHSPPISHCDQGALVIPEQLAHPDAGGAIVAGTPALPAVLAGVDAIGGSNIEPVWLGRVTLDIVQRNARQIARDILPRRATVKRLPDASGSEAGVSDPNTIRIVRIDAYAGYVAARQYATADLCPGRERGQAVGRFPNLPG